MHLFAIRVLEDEARYEVKLSGDAEHKIVKSPEWLSLLHEKLARIYRCQDSLRSRNVETVGFKWARSITPARPNGFPLTERLVMCDQGISDRDRLRRQSERARARPERDRGGRVEKRLAFISTDVGVLPPVRGNLSVFDRRRRGMAL